MATIDNAIVIDDDDDHEEHDAVLTQEQQDSVQLLMEILHIPDRSYAWRQLQASGFDLQLALSRLLYSQPSTTTTTTTTTSASVPPEEEKRDSKPIFGSPKTSISNKSVDHARNDDIKNSLKEVVSDPWQRCLGDSDSSNTPFVDPDFPPTRTSLDGRREGSSTSTTPNAVFCLCKLPAAARTVQSDGPNYGRFYLGCGQKNQRRRFQRRHNETDNSLDSCSDPPPIKPCNFFQWDKDGSKGGGAGDYSAQWPQLAWHSFVGPEYVLYHKQMCPDQIRQGAVGNCWFLSALAVVAEKPYLVQKLVPHSHQTPNKNKGGYQINLCLDGKWTTVIVDSNLPVVYSQQKEKASKKQSSSLSLAKKQDFRGGAVLQGGTVVAYPAFCAIPRGQLWSALVEKAYAKAHGSYANLSGGFIAEGLADLTGAPCETIVLDLHHLHSKKQELWARMLSFSEAGFLLGVATSQGGDGLVGGHAYSILAVQEIHDSLVGAQPKVTDFFVNPKAKKQKVNKNNEPKQQQQRETIRLVRIRNPWGKKEWRGAWSVNSETWTNRLRQKLGDDAWAKDDGTFWMSFDDMLDRFHHMDVCKTREGWAHSSIEGSFEPRDPLLSSRFVYTIRPAKRTWAFISLIQPKKRANTTTRYWYCDPSMIIVKRPKCSNEDDWECQSATFRGVSRRSNLEVFLDPSFEYCVIPFAGIPRQNSGSYAFRLTSYSSCAVDVQSQPREYLHRQQALNNLHKELLKDERKLLYPVAPQGVLACIQGTECMYFVGINASPDHFLSLLLTVYLRQGVLVAFGCNGDTHDIPPKSQKILLLVTSNGKASSSTQLGFKYVSDVVACQSRTQTPKFDGKVGLGNSINISLAGDLATSDVNTRGIRSKGGDTVNTYSWIPQLGAMK